jgi:hypothetical protein
MIQTNTVILSIAYLPPIAWFQHALQADKIVIEQAENYVKQSYRNRCKILTANGPMDLSIPIQHGANKHILSVYTQEEEAWRKQHWQAICSAYGKSAFFLYYRDAIEIFYQKRGSESLFAFNFGLIQLLCKQLKISLQFELNQEYESAPVDKRDLRNYFNSKGIPNTGELLNTQTYYQVFADKYPFQPNLSILDLLFNIGPRSIDFLRAK